MSQRWRETVHFNKLTPTCAVVRHNVVKLGTEILGNLFRKRLHRFRLLILKPHGPLKGKPNREEIGNVDLKIKNAKGF